MGAFNFAVTNSVGAFLVLIGIGLLYGRTGALNLAQIGAGAGRPARADGLVITALTLITCGLRRQGGAGAVPVLAGRCPRGRADAGLRALLGRDGRAGPVRRRCASTGPSSPAGRAATVRRVRDVWVGLGVLTALVGGDHVLRRSAISSACWPSRRSATRGCS